MLLKSLFDSSKVVSADEIDAAIVSSVVPSVTQRIVEMADRLFDVRCRVVGPGLKTGMPILYEDPREVGADRIVNAVAAFDRWPEGLIIVDFGTATTFDVVAPDGKYLGGSICPGIGVSSNALFQNAARLSSRIRPPKQVVGRNTVASIQSGLVLDMSAFEGLIQRIRDEVDFEVEWLLLAGLVDVSLPKRI